MAAHRPGLLGEAHLAVICDPPCFSTRYPAKSRRASRASLTCSWRRTWNRTALRMLNWCPFAEWAISSGAGEVSEIQGVEVAPLTLRRASMLWNEHTSQRGGSDCKIETAGHIREGGYKPVRTWSIGRSTLITRAPWLVMGKRCLLTIIHRILVHLGVRYG